MYLVWKEVRPTILDRWHGGSEEVEVNGEQIGLGLEFELVEQLLEGFSADEVVAAIEAAPRLLDWETPRSLRWFTSEQFGGDNIHTALSLHRSSSPGPVLDVAAQVAQRMRMSSPSDRDDVGDGLAGMGTP